MVKSLPASEGDTGDAGVTAGSGQIPWRRKWQPTPVFLREKSLGQRSLTGYSSWSHKESDTTEYTHIYTHTKPNKTQPNFPEFPINSAELLGYHGL